FLREGTALEDTLHPNKIVVGTKNPDTIEAIRSLFRGIDAPYIITSYEGAELIKYASNAFLAMKISFVNEIARICEAYGASIKDVTQGIGTDPRIGQHFLGAGLGYGGSCLPKDVTALEHIALRKGVIPMILHAVKSINDSQIDQYVNKLKEEIGNLKGKQITVWGLSFKAHTDDVRSSPSLRLVEQLVDKNCYVHTYDPLAAQMDSLAARYDDLYEALDGSDALIVATDWPQFIEADWEEVKLRMKGNLILDARNCLEPSIIRSYGFRYTGVAVQ
ncbi:MAG TPA: nucleotide sugar dehydrogenase, partial [Bacillales bacterium]|nr:nucleotide sugar dehydrogenase [Bacillales bacterium]